MRKTNRKIAIITALCMIVTLTMPITSKASTVSDISGHWANNTIQNWVEKDFISGYPDGTFRPENNISRAEFMTIVNKSFGFTSQAGISYSDVNIDDWYFGSVAAAQAAGYISGYPDVTMRPDNPISREEVATIIMKIKKLQENVDAANIFSDAMYMTWSKGAIGAVAKAEIMKGYPNGGFIPQNNIKRGEALVAVNGASKYIPMASAPLVSRDDEKNTVSGMLTTMEYKLDSANWTVYNATAFNKVDFSGNHTLMVRFAAAESTPFSQSTTLTFITNEVITGGGGTTSSGGPGTAVVDTTALANAISAANTKYTAAVEGIDIGQYATGSKATFNTAILAAQQVAGDASSTQSHINQAVTNLATAEGVFNAAMVTTVDTTALANAISAANTKYTAAVEGIDIGQYATGSKATFNTAILAAQQVAGDASSTQTQINQAVTNLATADGAFNAAMVTTVDTTALANAISAANTKYNAAMEGIAVGQYATGSKALFKTAIDAAQEVLGNTGSTQTQINQAVANLGTAEGVFDAAKVIAVDKAEFANAISAANVKYTAAQEGTATGEYTVGSKAAYKAAIDSAQGVVDNAGSTQPEINQAAVSFGIAESIFNEAKIAAAKLLFTFDDGYTNDLTIAAPSLEKVGFKGTAYVTKDDTVAGQDDMMRIGSVETLYGTYGWDIGNHSAMHNHLPAVETTEEKYATTTDAINDYLSNRDWLISNGLTRAANHVAYAYGERNQELMDGLIANGCKTGRLAYYGMQSTPVGNYFMLKAQEVGNGNLATVKLEIDKAVDSGATIILLMHKINDTDTGTKALYTINTTDFQSLIDYVKAYSLEAKIDVTTISEWYASTDAGIADALLAAAKMDAYNVLTAAFEGYAEADYTPENWITLTGFRTTGDTEITSATDLDGVTAAQTAATNGMAGVQTIAEALAEEKTSAHGVLATARASYTDTNYTAENLAALDGFRTTGDAAIDAATDLVGVAAAVAAATTGMAGVAQI